MNKPQSHPSHPKYRPDIDGLRTVAVLSVVTFHAFPNWINGGFIGVDVFFVISGFLISTIIFENLDKGTFSFAEFYARRITRIFPALLIVLIASYAFGWFALLADEYAQLGQHMAAGAGFVSNFVLWGDAGYFDNSSETKPLLHLWSLGIEEQFYIVWPLLLWFAGKRKFSFLTLTVIVALFSFALNIKGVGQDPVATFYSPQTRFWELLCGGILAWFSLYKKEACEHLRLSVDGWMAKTVYRGKIEIDGGTVANVLSLLGVLLLAYGFWRISKNSSFPGMWALIPVSSAGLIILAGTKAWINRTILSNRVLVWFGLISFPLYLWHWPLLSFARIVEGEVPGRSIRLAAVLLSIVLAWLTYQFVERPVRFGTNSKIKVIVLVVLMMIVGGLGYNTYVWKGLGFGSKSSVALAEIAASARLLNEAADNCNAYFPEWTKLTNNPCRLQKKKGNTIAIIGDSHAGQLYLGMSELLGPAGGVAVFAASCAAPYIDISSATRDPKKGKAREGAYRLINSAYDFVIHDPGIKTVVLAHHPSCSFGDVKDMANPGNKDANNILGDGMRRTFSALVKAHKKVIVVFDNPFLPHDPEQCLDRPFMITTKGNQCFFPRSEFDSLAPWSNYKSLVNSVLRSYPEIKTYDLSEPLCDREYCYLTRNNSLLYRDRGHLNDRGSRYVAPYIMNAINLAQ